MQAIDNRRISIGELKAVCRKGARDPFWISNIFWRPVSIYLSWLLVRAGVRSNQVTLISGLFAFGSSLVLLVPSDRMLLTSVCLMQIFFLLDHVDGEIARFHAEGSGPGASAAGRYFDALIHYFQGPSLYYCLGAGLSLAEGDLRWAILGAVAAIGSSGFPRFVASWVLLGLAVGRSDGEFREYLGRITQFNAAYWKPEERPSRFFIIPRNRAELFFAGKQYISFPGNLFTFAAVVLLDVFLMAPGEMIFVKLFLTFYAVVLLVNLLFVAHRYLVSLSRLPG